jgi:molybdopterin molybdotransferase
MRGFRDRAEVADVVALLAARLQPLDLERTSLSEASRRVLAEDMIADVEVPPFDRAAMDGYALRAAETFGAGPYNPLQFTIIGQVLPGRPFTGEVRTGQAVRIMTGAPLPRGADAVLQAEAGEEQDEVLHVTEAVPPGRNIGRQGEDIAKGTVVLRAGRQLRPQDVGVLASIGANSVAVVRRPRVAIIVTGDELLPCGARPSDYHIVDSNSVMLEALVRRDGGLPESQPLVPDRREAVEATLLGTDADALLVSGGTSVGLEDHAPRVLAEHGELAVHGMALRPASPAGVGFLGDRPVFLLPGNPVSCLCAYDFFAGPALRRLGGRSLDWPYPILERPLARKLVSAVGRVDYVRVQLVGDEVEPLATSGASILSSTTRADGFVLVPRDSEGYAVGERVRVYLYDQSATGP